VSRDPDPSGDRRRLLEVATGLGLEGAEVRPLSGGSRNRNYRLVHPAGDVVVRIGGEHDPEFAVARDAEVRAQRAAADAGLAPPVVLDLHRRGILVSEFVEGTVWSREHARSQSGAHRVGRWLAALHGLETPGEIRAVEFAASLRHYVGSLPPGRLPAGILERARQVNESLSPEGGSSLCHNDLHHLNLIETERGLVAVDWEYAGRGTPLMDLAGYAAYHELDVDAEASLLGGYGTIPTEACLARLAAARWLFEAVWLAWLELKRELDATEPPAMRRERERLATRVRLDGPVSGPAR